MVSRATTAPGSPQAEPEYELPSASEIAALIQADTEPSEDPQNIADADAGADITPQTPADTDEGSTADQEAADKADDIADPDPKKEGVTPEQEEDPENTEEEPPAAEATDDEEKKSRYQKRLDELTAAAAAHEREAATLREQLAAAKATAQAADPLNPFALIDTEPELDAAIEREERLMEWVMANEANPDGADLDDGKGGTVHFEPDQIRQIKVNTYRALRTAAKRREFIQQRMNREAEAVQSYPWLRSTKEGLGAEVQAVIESRPYLRTSPDYRTFAADAIVGAKLRAAGVKLDQNGIEMLLKGRAPARVSAVTAPAGAAALAASRTTTAPVRRTAPSPARPGNLPPRMNGREAAARQASKALSSGAGDLATVSDSIAAKMRW